MTKLWLILDVPSMAHRAFHAMGGLSHEGKGTGAIFGVLRDVIGLRERFEPDNFVFCFDGRNNKRRKMCPEYKAGRRRALDREERRAFDNLRGQIDRLHRYHLKAIGFRNVFRQEGYEADDLIAEACRSLPNGDFENPIGDKAIVVSSDGDLYQLLSERVTMWSLHRKKLLSADWFRREYGIGPDLWADVKALAGCSSDELPGIERVGERTAILFLNGDLKNTTKAHRKIIEGNGIYKRNIELTRLPMVGVGKMELREDKVSEKRWNQVMERLGIKRLRPKGARK